MEGKMQGMIPVSEPSIGKEELDNLRECAETGWISSAGAFVKQVCKDNHYEQADKAW